MALLVGVVPVIGVIASSAGAFLLHARARPFLGALVSVGCYAVGPALLALGVALVPDVHGGVVGLLAVGSLALLLVGSALAAASTPVDAMGRVPAVGWYLGGVFGLLVPLLGLGALMQAVPTSVVGYAFLASVGAWTVWAATGGALLLVVGATRLPRVDAEEALS
ncbi:MAG: hypothetical protein EP330_17930 [Deltaproteobacteria bacterium]|nr:MAG: hypothetical protein EP330_17930 [Deltaproteobacteria bacterium]